MNKKASNERLRLPHPIPLRDVVVGVLKILLIAGIFVGAVLCIQARPTNRIFVNKYATYEVARTDGTHSISDKKIFGIVNKGDVVTVHLHLPEKPLLDDAVLTFYIYHSVTEITCGGKLLDSYGADIDARGDMVGNARFLVRVPDEAWGGEITITMRVTENSAFAQVKNLGIYPAKYAYQYYIDVGPVDFYTLFPLFVLGVLGFAVFVTNRKFHTVYRKPLYISLFIIIASLYFLTSKGVQHMFGLDGYGWTVLEFITLFSIAYPLLLWALETEEKGTWMHKLLGAVILVNAAFFAIAAFLNFTNILHYCRLVLMSCILTFASGIVLFIFALRRFFIGHKSDRLFFSGMCIMFTAGLIDLLRTNLNKFFSGAFNLSLPSMLPLGVLFLLFYMLSSYLLENAEQQEKVLTANIEAANLNDLLESIPTGVCRVIPDEHLTIVAANSFFYRIIGYRENELDQTHQKHFFSKLYEDEARLIRQKVAEIVSGQETTGEFEFDTVDIDDRPLTVLVKYSFNPEKGNYITANVIDITERKRISEELRIREEDYRTAIEASDHLYLNYDAATKTCTHLFDSEELFGISEKVENIPQSLIDLGLCAPESIDEYRRAFEMFAAGVPKGDICLHLRNIKTNELRWYAGSFRTIFDANGKPLHAIAAFKDITEQREKEIAFNIRRQQIEAQPEDSIAYYELNLTTGTCEYHYGTDAKQIIAHTSEQWDEMLVYAVDTLVQAKYKKTMLDSLRCSHLVELYEHGVMQTTIEYLGYKTNVAPQWLRASVNVASDPQTQEIRAYCTVEDIDAEKAQQLEREAELERSRYYSEAYDKLSSSVMYGVCKYQADADLQIVFANDIFYRMHGFRSQEDAVAAGFTSILDATPPFGREIVRAAHSQYIDGTAGPIFETEYPTTDVDGKRIWVLCRGTYSPEEKMFNASVLDITDRKRTEEQLRISEERYKLALTQSGKVFFFFDVPSKTMFLSDELAQAFGLPNEVDGMPDNFIAQGLVEPQSVENYRHFYERIYAGEKSGETIISCHVRQAPETVLWYRIAFTSIADANGVPQSAVITYEDLQEQRARELAGAWKQMNLLTVPETKYVIVEYDLTQNRQVSQSGALFEKVSIPSFVVTYDEINAYVLDHFVFAEDVPALREFLNRQRILEMFDRGETEDYIEYRSLQHASSPRWTSSSIQMIRDPYSGNVFLQLLIMDIHAQKAGQLEMEHDLEELRKELESSRIKVMINQMQPHFLYNALSAIQTIVKTDPDYAYQLIYDFTVHLRSSIKALSSDAPIPFIDELKNIKAYLNIEQMRFGDSLRVQYEIDCEDFSVIPLSIQPLAENAARHGVYPKGDEGGTVTVRSYETATAYVVEVEDDGVGFDVNTVLNRESDSVGLKSLIFRLKSLMDADVFIFSKKDIGTKVRITIPKKEGED